MHAHAKVGALASAPADARAKSQRSKPARMHARDLSQVHLFKILSKCQHGRNWLQLRRKCAVKHKHKALRADKSTAFRWPALVQPALVHAALVHAALVHAALEHKPLSLWSQTEISHEQVALFALEALTATVLPSVSALHATAASVVVWARGYNSTWGIAPSWKQDPS